MLVNWTQPKHVFIVCGKTDLRKGIDGLAAVVAENYDLDLFDDSVKGGFELSFYGGLKMHDLGGLRINRC